MVLFKRDRNCSRISIATWNVQGLSAKEKKEQLGRDCNAYAIDLMCIQETKVPDYDEINLLSGNKLILMKQKSAKHRGLGFVIGPCLIRLIGDHTAIQVPHSDKAPWRVNCHLHRRIMFIDKILQLQRQFRRYAS